MLTSKLWIHLFILPRHFAAPFFLGSIAMGIVLAGGSLWTLNAWLVLLAEVADVYLMVWAFKGSIASAVWGAYDH